MILAKRKTKLSNGIVAVEKVTKYKYSFKPEPSYFYYVDLNRGSENVFCNGSEKISEEQAMKLVEEFKNEKRKCQMVNIRILTGDYLNEADEWYKKRLNELKNGK